MIARAAEVLGDEAAVFTAADAKQAAGLVKQLRAATKIPVLRSDLETVRLRIAELGEKKQTVLIASFLRKGPPKRTAQQRAKDAAKKTRATSPKTKRGRQ